MDCLDENLTTCFLAGDLDEAARTAVEEHMDRCPDCLLRLTAVARAQALSRGGSIPPEEPTPPPPRSVLRRGDAVGRYVVHGMVGVGAMGTVYAAADPVLQRTVALKLVTERRRSAESVAAAAERLLREARVLAQVAHPNVVAVHDVGTFDGRVFVAMDLVDGQTLREWLDEPRTTRAILDVFVQAGRGLQAAHAAGVVHRDFKPENVLVGRDGRVLVSDFGLAWAGALETLGSGVVGTPAYMAPEQERGLSADPRADQYSFCVALHEALHGSRPREALPELPRWAADRRRRAVSGHLRAAIMRGLTERPEDRFPSIDALLAALTRDRWQRAKRIALVAAPVLLAAAAVTGHVEQERRATAACHVGAAAPIAALWSTSEKEAMRARFEATGKPFAADAFRSVAVAIDRYAEDWTQASAEACVATNVRHEQSATMLATRNACYRERLEELRAVVEVVGSGEVAIVRNASGLVRELAPLSVCESERALGAVAPPPPAAAAEVARLRGALARGRALRNAGKMEASLAAIAAAEHDAAALGYAPLEAFALVELGLIQSRLGDKATADTTMARAARVADAARDDGARIRALGQRLYIRGSVRHTEEGVAELEAEATSALARLGGGDPRAEEAYHYTVGMAWLGLRGLDRALGHLTRSAELTASVYGPESYDAARAESGLCLLLGAQRQLDRAIPHCERTASLFRSALGPHHPDYALAEQNLGSILMAQDRYAEACPRLAEAHAVGVSALGREHAQVVAAESNLGGCLDHRGEHARAIALLEEALALRQRVPGVTPLDLAHTQTKLARAYVEAGAPERAVDLAATAQKARDDGNADADDRAASRFVLARALASSRRGDATAERRARSLAKEALALLAPGGGTTTQRDEIEQWLAAPR